MSENTLPQPAAEQRERSVRYIIRYIFAVLVFPVFAYTAWKYGIWPYPVLGLVSYGIPMILLGFNSWNRSYHPERVPTRWPERSRIESCLMALNGALILILIVSISTLIFGDHPKDHTEHIWLYFIVWSSFGWGAVLQRYIDEREFIPPPDPPYDPSQRWDASLKPLHSDHWGERETPRTESFES